MAGKKLLVNSGTEHQYPLGETQQTPNPNPNQFHFVRSGFVPILGLGLGLGLGLVWCVYGAAIPLGRKRLVLRKNDNHGEVTRRILVVVAAHF